MIRQFVPSDFCLKCLGCCRFKDAESVWSPCLLEEEAISLVDREGIPAASISIDRRLNLVTENNGESFLCPFLKSADNHCQIYHLRPLECQLYPFLLSIRDKKVLLTVDLKCPYIQGKINSEEFKEYVNYLTQYLNSPKQLALLKSNPQILQAYEDVLDVVELES